MRDWVNMKSLSEIIGGLNTTTAAAAAAVNHYYKITKAVLFFSRRMDLNRFIYPNTQNY